MIQYVAKQIFEDILAQTSPRFQTTASVMVFLVAALLRPEIQTKAQEELDAVTGRERLPTFEDRPKLPFVDAICKEVLRWRPIAPLGELLSSIHFTSQKYDDPQEYLTQRQKMTSITVSLSLVVGIFDVQSLFLCWLICIFQVRLCLRIYGAIYSICPVFFNLASTPRREILHDPVMYPEPDAFKPERFIDPDGGLRDDPVLTTVFGFGKRICPGRHLADATLFIVIASLLSVFDVKKGKGADGGPDMYSFTGSSVRCGDRVSLAVHETWRADPILDPMTFPS